MSQRVSNSFVNTNIPGSYLESSVKSNPIGVAASGIVVIIGEADGGQSYQNEVLADNSFTPDQFARVKQKYVSGQIVDAFKAFTAPSNDSDITGSASRIFIIKTNSSSQASALVDTDYGTMKDQNFGKGGNQYKFQVTSTAAESAPQQTGGVIGTYGAALNGLTFSIRQNGGAEASVTLSATAGDHTDRATLLTELASLLPSGVTATAGTAANTIKISMDADNSAFRKSWGKSLEFIDTNAGDLAAIGFVAETIVSAQEPSVEVSVSRADTGLSETVEAEANIALEVGYEGTTATLTINQSTKTLTTTMSGGSGGDLSMDLSSFRTIADVATYISAQSGYSASASAAAQQMQPTQLDAVSAIGICSTAAGQKPGRVKAALNAFKKAMSASRGVTFTATATGGLPAPMANPAFLSGGARGATLAADIVSAMEQLTGIQCNIIVPLFSRNSSEDVSEGLTDSSSTYTIDAIHAAVKSHCIAYSTPKLKRNRICILSYWGTYTATKQKAQGLASFRASLAFQKSTQEDSNGANVSFLPWYSACIAAGMQAGGFYKAIVNKAANVISLEDPSGFNSGSPGDVEDALDAGLLILANDTTRNYWVSDQTTYGYDSSFVYNSIQAVYTSDLLALDLADSFQKAFVGKSLADVDAATALSFLAQKMDKYKKNKLIASSDEAPLGWKNAKVSISAPVMEISVEIKLATAIYFVPISLSISQVQQTA